jgi:hypothetical protein
VHYELATLINYRMWPRDHSSDMPDGQYPLTASRHAKEIPQPDSALFKHNVRKFRA